VADEVGDRAHAEAAPDRRHLYRHHHRQAPDVVEPSPLVDAGDLYRPVATTG
jgi:hypothetical protein